ncbi:MAG: V-type ATP synthase subunit B, partial [Anaerorhabdus sp.]
MSLQLLGLNEISGSLVALDHVANVSNEEMVEIQLNDGSIRSGRVVQIEGEKAVVQVFEGTAGLSKKNTKTRLLGHPMEIALSREILGRVFNGAGKPIDGLGEVYAEKFADINGKPLNPVARQYPRNYINTGISAIDGLNTLIRGQKLPIFSGSGMPHDKLAVQIVRQAQIADDDGKGFGIVFGAMGVKNDVADYFKRSFEETGVMEKVCMFVNLSND